MAVRRSIDNINVNLGEVVVHCTICNDTSQDTDIVETHCKHKYHRSCLSDWLTSNETCPICRQLCSLPLRSQSQSNLQSGENAAANLSYTGAIPKNRPKTRSQVRNTPKASSARPNPRPGPGQTRRVPESNVLSEGNIQRLISESMTKFQENMTAVISEKITTELRNLNLTNVSRNFRDEPQLEWESDIAPSLPRMSSASNLRNNSYRPRPSSARANFTDIPSEHPDKISNIISKWRIKFSGSSKDIPIEDFIYRVNCLTNNCLNGNFTLLAQFASLLFTDSALSFYWRVHRTTNNLDWYELCSRLQERYQDQRSDREIKAAMRRRKQGSNESFDDFLDAMLSIADSLREPMQDGDVTIEVRENLKSELKLDLLHIETPDLATLRKECHKHEEFFRNLKSKPFSRHEVVNSKRFVNSISHDEEAEDNSEKEGDSLDEVYALRSSDFSKCWNCEEQGHKYQECLKPRRIFCYGCGVPDTYKPNCAKCKSTTENVSQDVRRLTRRDIRR